MRKKGNMEKSEAQLKDLATYRKRLEILRDLWRSKVKMLEVDDWLKQYEDAKEVLIIFSGAALPSIGEYFTGIIIFDSKSPLIIGEVTANNFGESRTLLIIICARAVQSPLISSQPSSSSDISGLFTWLKFNTPTVCNASICCILSTGGP